MGESKRRAGMGVVVCALVLAVFALATQAKIDQYAIRDDANRHSVCVTKMCEDRGQRQATAVWLYRAVAPAQDLEPVEMVSPRPPAAPEPRLIGFTDPCLYRPPPFIA